MINPEMPPRWSIPLGACTERLAGLYGVGRDSQDEFAVRSHRLTANAWDAGFYDLWVAPVPGTGLNHDESVRRDTSVAALAKLKPAFVTDGTGTVTAGNSSPLSDGAAALFLGDEAAGRTLGREPIARIVSRGLHAVDPDVFGIAPVEAASRALARAGIGWHEVEVVELNEAFAAQSLACLGEWKELDPNKVNVNGGAIAIGHPLGASGARILASLAYELARRGGGYGLAAICIGVGQGLALVLEA
jgi:acetyl-CoA acetyltransferase family protein